VIDRRAFLQGLVTLAACDTGEAALSSSVSGRVSCGDTRAGVAIPFLDERELAKNTLLGEGLDGRLYTDLRNAGSACDSVITPNEQFYIRTRVPDRIDYTTPWRIRGDVDLAVLDLKTRPMGATLLECSGNARGGSFGLLSVATWSGVPLLELLPPNAERSVLVTGFDDHSQPSTHSVPGASWIFTRADLEATGAFLATHMNDAPLPPDHGAPVRLVVPGWYGCTCIKWVSSITMIRDDNNEPATAHMREFASRTHQIGEPLLARDFRPANIELAAMPIDLRRVSQSELVVRGICWGGEQIAPSLELMLFDSGSLAPRTRSAVAICCARSSTRTWSFWSASLEANPGNYDLALRSLTPAKTRRLDSRFYLRSFSG